MFMKGLLFTVMMSSAAAFAGNYPLLNDYEAVAKDALALARKANAVDEVQKLLELQRKLVAMGADVMRLYATKNPICQAQFDVYLNEISTSEAKTVAELHSRYHDGTGLPVAPKHCYLGRSQAVHPSMNVRRILDGWSESARADIVDETDEVIRHNAKVERNLDNPPN